MNGEHVGNWTVDVRGQHEFRYGQARFEADGARPLSLSMPLQPPDAPYRGDLVESFFDNLLPDSIDIRVRKLPCNPDTEFELKLNQKRNAIVKASQGKKIDFDHWSDEEITFPKIRSGDKLEICIAGSTVLEGSFT